MKRIIITLYCSVIAIHCYSQQSTISGKITDRINGETLLGVNILAKGETKGTTSNEYGFYTLSLENGSYTLVYSSLGYKTVEKTVQLNKDITLNVELEEDVTQLNEVMISAEDGKSKMRVKSPQMSINQLNVKTIKQVPVVFGEVDILKTITLLPSVTNAGEGSSGFHVRGGASDQNLILLDEATIYNTSHLFGFFSIFNADAIKDLKLYKGGIPSKFGGRVSSVLDVRQKDGNTKQFGLKGGIGLISSRLMAEGPLKKEKGSFLIAGRTSYANLFLQLADEPNRASFYDFNAKFSYELNDNNKLFLSGYLGRDTFKFQELFENRYGNKFFNLRWNHLFSKKLFSNLSFIYNNYDYSLSFKSNGFKWLSSINNLNLKYDFDYSVNNNHKLNFGININEYKFNPGEIVKTNQGANITEDKLDGKQAIETAIYVESEQNFRDKFSIRYGFRFSSFFRKDHKIFRYPNNQPVIYNNLLNIYQSAVSNGFDSYSGKKKVTSFYGFEPRLSLSYILNENTSLKASYQNINQYLHLISNTNSATPLDIWTPSGTYIKPQRSNQYAIGLFKNFKSNTFSLEVEGYYKTVANRIDYIDGADLIANNTIETEILSGESRAYGFEFLLQKNKGRLKGWLSYTLSKSQQRVQGRTSQESGINNGDWYNTAYDRTHDISLTATYKLDEKWSFGTNFIFQTGRPTNYASGQYQFEDYTIPVFTTRNEERLPAYHRLDISATLAPRKNKDRKWQGQWVFGIYNIYDRRNAASINFRRNDTEMRNEAVKTTIFGIMPAVTYNFKF